MMHPIFLQVLRTSVGHRLAKVQGYLFKSAFLRRIPTFTRLIIENLLLCFLQSTLYQTSKYLTGSLGLRFKKILTDLVHADYFEVCWVIKLDLPILCILCSLRFQILPTEQWNNSLFLWSLVTLEKLCGAVFEWSHRIDWFINDWIIPAFLIFLLALCLCCMMKWWTNPSCFLTKQVRFLARSDELKIVKFWKINTW